MEDATEPSRDFHVSAHRLRTVLLYLKSHNKFYTDIDISEEALNLLPDDGNIYENLQYVSLTADEQEETIGEPQQTIDEPEMDYVTHGNAPGFYATDQESEIRATIDPEVVSWPNIGSTPINEFQTEGFVVCAFPALFPAGTCDLRDPTRICKISAEQYFKHLLKYENGRFAKDPRFRFLALNSTLRWEAIKLGNLFVRKRNMVRMTGRQLRELLVQRPSIANEIAYFTSSLRASRSFWYQRCSELQDMVRSIGAPTVFFTLSAADLHWPEIYKLLAPEEDLSNSSTSMQRRRQLLIENPLIVNTLFQERANYFIKNVLGPKFDVQDFWYR